MINTLLKRRMENTKKNKKGFTLVELIVVLVIIAILAAILIPTMSGYISRARKTSAQSGCKTQVTAVAAAASDLLGGGVTDLSSINCSGGTVSDATFKTSAEGYGASFGTGDKAVSAFTLTEDGAVASLTYKEGKYTVTYNGTTQKYTVS